jgi:hypothetical protein
LNRYAERGFRSGTSYDVFRELKCSEVTFLEDKDMPNQSIILEFWEFLKMRKRYWLLPIVLVLLLLGALIVFTESSAVAPFIYALF